MLLRDLLKGCGASGNYDGEVNVSSVCCNSEDVKKGSLFIALKGTKYDGKYYVAEALNRGAVCAVCEGNAVFDGAPLAFVSNARSACARIYSNLYKNPDAGMKTVAITGTNGKSTVASMLEHIYVSSGVKTGLIGTVHKRVNGEDLESFEDTMTTPDPHRLYKYLRRMKDVGCGVLIMEASSHALALSKLDGMHVDMGLFTNLTPEHLDFHGTMENYYAAKKKLFEKAKLSAVNYDDYFGKRLCREIPSALAVSADPKSAADQRVWATAAMYRSRGFSGIEYMFCCGETVFPVSCKMIGKNALYNTLLAAAAALADGIDPHIISAALASFKGVSGRFETVCHGAGVPTVIVDYAHTPDSFEKVLLQTRELMKRGRKLTVVFGCGGERDVFKRSVMGASAEKYADRVIITDDNPRGEDPDKIRKEIFEGIKNKELAAEIGDRKKAIERAVALSRAGDVILVLGKGHEEYVIDKNGKRPFFEREIIKNAVFDVFGAM